MKSPEDSRYTIKSLVHASQVLAVFESSKHVLGLRDVVALTGLKKGMCFRLLYTLHRCGFLDRVGHGQFRTSSAFRPRRRWRIGYAGQGQATSFPRDVRDSLVLAAQQEGIELIVLDNRYDPKVALYNADCLVRQQVDLVIEFQTDEAFAAEIAAKYRAARIPVIAIGIPHPGATYFGADNFGAGQIAGRYLGKWANKYWGGRADEILLIALARAGSVTRTRLRGISAGVVAVLAQADDARFVTVEGDGQFDVTQEVVRRHLRLSCAERVLIGAANDPSALGAARAFQEAGRASACAVVGQNAEPEARAELREPGTPLIASVAYFAEKHGDGLVRLALNLLAGRPVPPAVFMKHLLITPDNVDQFYPNDELVRLSEH